MRRPALAGLLAGLALVGHLGCRPAAAPTPRPDVLLITIDTLRPDALGWVAGRNATPNLDGLARSGFATARAVASVPLTLPSHVSLFTGLHPHRHGIRDNGMVLGAQPRTLAETFSAAGYATGAVVSGYPLRSMFGLDRGFERYEDAMPLVPGRTQAERPAADATAQVLAWLAGQKKKDPARPYFLWVHYYDPHLPYQPPARFRPATAASPKAAETPGLDRTAYDGEVRAVDHAIGVLLRGLDEIQARPRITTVTADHGESLGEHGEASHGFFVFDATILVPLIVHAPGRIAVSASAASPRLIDLAPSLLELAGLPALAETDGISLAPLLAGRPQDLPTALSETRVPYYGYGWAPLAAARSAEAKWIEAPIPELYDLARDPGETTNLAGGGSAIEVGERLRRELAAELRKAPLASAGVSEDPEVAAQLRSLGYAGGSSSSAEPGSGLADPKDRIRLKTFLDLAEDSMAAGDIEDGLALFDLVLARDPDNRYALLRSGAALTKIGQHAAARRPLERLLSLDPRHAEARFELADALGQLGRVVDAKAHWLELLAQQPRRAVAWSNLGALELRLGNVGLACPAFERAVALEPGDATLRANLAECLHLGQKNESKELP
jgi:choline-sulfatase